MSFKQRGTYVACSEAYLRLFEFSIHDRYPTVVNLQVHLPNGQRVLFTEENAHAIDENPPKQLLLLSLICSMCKKYGTKELRYASDSR